MSQLRVEGEVQSPRVFSFADLATLPRQVPDVGMLIPSREGGGVRLRSILELVGVRETATHITVVSSDGTFSASVPLEAVHEAVVAYRLENQPLPPQKGGPIRFFIPHVEDCAIGGVDACANVKFVGLIRLSRGPGEDTRPTSASPRQGRERRCDASGS
jgi:2-dehydropantoate 2-reductase